MLDISPKSFISSDLIGNKIANKIKITSPCYLCDYSNAYILVKVTLTFIGKGAYSAITDAYGNNKQVLYKYLAQFIDCIFEITNIKKDYAKDLDVVMLMLMHNLE